MAQLIAILATIRQGKSCEYRRFCFVAKFATIHTMEIVDAEFIKRRTLKRGDKARLADSIGMPRNVLTKVTKGGRKLTPEEIAAILSYFGMTITSGPTHERAPSGFAEAAAAPFSLPKADGKSSVVRALFPELKQWTSYRISQDHRGFLLARNDVVVLNTANKPQTDDLVLLSINAEMGTVREAIGRWLDPWIVFDNGDSPIRTDDEQIHRLIGTIAGNLRGLSMEPDPVKGD